MCIIVLDPRDSQERVSKDILKRCEEKNPDGMGIMYARDENLKMWWTMKDFEGIWNRYTHARDNSLPVAIHFRKTTKGTTHIDNCHPFEVFNGIGMMHNGTMSWATKYLPDGISDTKWIVENLLQHWPTDFMNRPAFRAAFTELVDTDRILFMDYKGNYNIIDEGSSYYNGFWDNGVWYSKSTYRTWLLTGNSPKKGKSYSTGGGDTHSHHRNAANSWYAKQSEKKSNGVAGGDDRASNRHGMGYLNIIFDYGLMEDLFADDDRFAYGGEGYLEGYDLWAGLTRDDRIEVPLGLHSQDGRGRIYGKLYYIADHDSNLTDILTDLDEFGGSIYPIPEDERPKGHHFRTIEKITIHGNGASGDMNAWVWVGNEDHDVVDLIGMCNYGFWRHWLDNEEDKIERWDSAPVLDNDSDESDVVTHNIQAVAVTCDRCNSKHTKVYEEVSKHKSRGYKDILTQLWCMVCNEKAQLSKERVYLV